MKHILISLFLILLQCPIAFTWNHQLQHKYSNFIESHKTTMKKTIAIGLTLTALTSQPFLSNAAVGEGKYSIVMLTYKYK